MLLPWVWRDSRKLLSAVGPAFFDISLINQKFEVDKGAILKGLPCWTQIFHLPFYAHIDIKAKRIMLVLLNVTKK
jgi:hypothetical protein